MVFAAQSTIHTLDPMASGVEHQIDAAAAAAAAEHL